MIKFVAESEALAVYVLYLWAVQ